jgi:hypothetical protein
MNVNGLQLYQGKKFAGLTDTNHLANAFLTEPEMVNNTLSFVFGYKYNNPLSLFTGGLGKTRMLNNRQYDWKMIGDLERPISIVSNFGDGGSTPGLRNQPFRVVLAEKEFVSGEVLIPDNRDYPVIVLADPTQGEGGYIYTLQLINPDEQAFMPPALLTAGKEFSKDYSAFEEGSSRSGITTYGSPFELRNHLTTQRKVYEITGSAQTDVMAILMKDPVSGKTSALWSSVQEWTFLAQWYRELDRSLMYSIYNAKSNGTVAIKGESGRPTYIGAGLRQQISPSNKRTYTQLTENVIREFMLDLTYNVKGDGDAKFIAMAGWGFMDAFDRAMKQSASGWNLVDSKFVTGSGQNLTLGGQFTTYKGINGIEMTVVHQPLYDDPTHNRQLHPVTGRPVESYRATFIDYGMYNGESNIMKVAKNGRESVMWYTGGSTGPGGHHNSASSMGSSSFDGYAVHTLAETGIMIQNPMACGELILGVQAA